VRELSEEARECLRLVAAVSTSIAPTEHERRSS
jgi:hypothetical protein